MTYNGAEIRNRFIKCLLIVLTTYQPFYPFATIYLICLTPTELKMASDAAKGTYQWEGDAGTVTPPLDLILTF